MYSPRPLRASYDYIIVGGGSAGCVLANRLSSDPAASVLLLEAGPRDRGLLMAMPAAVYRVYQEPSINWNYESEPEPEMKRRRIAVPRGRVLGGSSSINAMVYLRGNPRDYDNWADSYGLPEWSYAHCLPYFRKSEASDRGESLYHGTQGELGVEQGLLKSEIFDAFLAAAAEAGHTVTDDLNGPVPEGIGRMDSTRRNGRRCSASVAFLRPVAARRNLHIVTGALVSALVMQGARARGVRFSSPEVMDVAAEREVILSAGAVNTPQLLMLSGIGPEDELRRCGIDMVHRSEGVGRNLQDHLNVGLKFSCKKAISIAWLDNPLAKAYVGAQWLLTKSGPAASNIWEVGGVFRSDPGTGYPNFQYHVGPVMMNAGKDGGLSLADGLMIHIAQLRQQSRGRIQLRSADSAAAPAINFGFLATARDKAEFRGALRVTRDIVSQGSLRAIGADETLPGFSINSDDEIDDFIATHANTEFHPSCTCRMGGDEDAVVDAELRVRGIDGLRVVDASVMPAVPCCNLNAPTIMIAEKAADMIAGRPALAPANFGQAQGSTATAREFA